MQDELLFLRQGRRLEELHVRSRGEEPGQRAGQDDRLDAVVGADALDRLIQLERKLLVVGVRRGPVERDLPDGPLSLKTDHVSHDTSPPSDAGESAGRAVASAHPTGAWGWRSASRP